MSSSNQSASTHQRLFASCERFSPHRHRLHFMRNQKPNEQGCDEPYGRQPIRKGAQNPPQQPNPSIPGSAGSSSLSCFDAALRFDRFLPALAGAEEEEEAAAGAAAAELDAARAPAADTTNELSVDEHT